MTQLKDIKRSKQVNTQKLEKISMNCKFHQNHFKYLAGRKYLLAQVSSIFQWETSWYEDRHTTSVVNKGTRCKCAGKQGLVNEVLGLIGFGVKTKKQKIWDLESGNFKLRQVEDAECWNSP